MEFLQDPGNAWLAAGAVIIAFEAFTAPGLGLFLVGLGAVSTALVIKGGLVSSAMVPSQFAWCFGLTVGWTIFLWQPLQKFRSERKSRGQNAMPDNNLIGEIVTVGAGGLKPGDRGQILWSGTLMNAQLDASYTQAVAEGAKVEVKSVSGNTLIVVPK